MDDFFQKRLAALVDTSTRPWRYKPVAERAADHHAGAGAVRARGAHQGHLLPRRRPRRRPCGWTSSRSRWTPSITQFILDVDGQLVKYAHGPVVPMAVQWPGPKGSNQVRVQISPPSATGSLGPDDRRPVGAVPHARRRPSSNPAMRPRSFFITFNIDNRRTRFEVDDQQRAAPDPPARAARVRLPGGPMTPRHAPFRLAGLVRQAAGHGRLRASAAARRVSRRLGPLAAERPGAAAQPPRRLDRRTT